MRRLVLALAVSLAASAAVASEPVATLDSQQGVVLVNQGEEFVTPAEVQPLNPGDRVMVMEGASARLVFSDGCQLPLDSGSMLVVPLQSTCAGAIAGIQRVGPSYAQAVGNNTSDRDLEEWVILGGVMIAIGVIVANDDDAAPEPVSP